MRNLLIITFIAAFAFGSVSSCKSKPGREEIKNRLDKLVVIHSNLLSDEQTFIAVLDSVNRLRETEEQYHDSLHASLMSGLSSAFNTYTQKIYDALGQTAAMANAGNDEAVDAMSEYLLGMRSIAEENYSEMVKLSSLRLDAYGEPELAAYTKLLEQAALTRQGLEDSLLASWESHAKAHKITLKAD